MPNTTTANPVLNSAQPTLAERARALEILYRVWVSMGIVEHSDVKWLAPRQKSGEFPVHVCLRLAGAPLFENLDGIRAYLEDLRQQAERDGRCIEDRNWVKDLRGRWVLEKDVKGPLGRPVEHLKTYLPPGGAS